MKILSHNLDGIKVVQNRFHFLFRDFLQTGDVGGSLHTTLPPLVINDTQGRVGWLGLGEATRLKIAMEWRLFHL